MKLPYHAVATITISGVLYMVFKSWGLAVSSFVAGIFIDLDHIIDYLRENGRPFKIKNFFRICHQCQFNKVILIWHGWEWIVLLGAAAWLTGWNPWITGMLIGITQHLLLDAINSIPDLKSLRSYSLIWRWKKDFDFDTLFPKMKNIKYRYIK